MKDSCSLSDDKDLNFDQRHSPEQPSLPSLPLTYGRQLQPEEYAILSELRETQLVNVILRLKNGETLKTIIDDIASPVAQRVRKAIKEQYATSTANLDGEAAGDSSLDPTISALISRDLTTTSDDEDLIRVASATPLRVTFEERQLLRLVESILEVSEYSDRVDSTVAKSEQHRANHQIKGIASVLDGLIVAHQYDVGQKLMAEHNYQKYARFFQSIFEIARRYKIANPEQMRSKYVKMMYFLMDLRAQLNTFQFDCIVPIQTVYSLLSKKQNGLALLKDPLIRVAIVDITPQGKTRQQIQWEIQQKEMAIKLLSEQYCTKSSSSGIFSRLTGSLFPKFEEDTSSESQTDATGQTEQKLGDLTIEEIQRCLYSLGDRNTYLHFNCNPCDKMIAYLKQYFSPNDYDINFTLAITAGQDDARLSHSHERQYYYVLQSLTLWKEILQEMLGLWSLAEIDILDPTNRYVLKDSGQGLQRVQNAPHVYRAMYSLLKNVQRKVGCWYGSSEIHLGDHNVPNALLCIDKYLQVPRILAPIVLCLENIPKLCRNCAMSEYVVDAFSSETCLIKTILTDFFRHGFDGSGADNFYDAGSCVDGRLTSAWNWCSKIESKPYFPIFLLSGFTGFDGRF